MTFGNVLIIMLIYIPLILLWVFALTDLSHRVDISGLAKGTWAVAIVLLPIIGMLIYFITRPHGDDAYRKPYAAPDQAPPAAAPAAAPQIQLSASQIGELEKLGDLKESGAITDDEFAKMKARIIG